jgi:hypothetical protein
LCVRSQRAAVFGRVLGGGFPLPPFLPSLQSQYNRKLRFS